MTENQKLRESAQQAIDALQLFASQYPHMQKGYMVDAIDALTQALALPTASLDAATAEIARLRAENAELQERIDATDASASVSGLTAAPVGERERFEAWWRSVRLMTFPKEYDIERLQDWGSSYKPKALEAWQARAALSAGDAVDAQRYRWLRDESWAGYNQGKGFPHVFTVDGAGNRRTMLAEEALDAAIDAAMRKDKP